MPRTRYFGEYLVLLFDKTSPHTEDIRVNYIELCIGYSFARVDEHVVKVAEETQDFGLVAGSLTVSRSLNNIVIVISSDSTDALTFFRFSWNG